MAALALKSLIERLDDRARASLEAAAGLTLSRTHYNVELEHWLLKLMDGTGHDLSLILRHFDIDEGRLAADLNRQLDRLKTGNSRAPALSPDIVSLIREAWLLASISHGLARVRSGHLLWALLADDTLARRAREMSGQLVRVPADALQQDFVAITASSTEAATPLASETAAPDGGAAPPRAGGGALDQYTVDLTAQARAGKIDPILGRDAEIRQVIDILTRRRQNNPILAGEAGVGKTAVVEGFAQKIAAGDVPPALRDVILRTLDLGLLQAGAGMKGEFENRLKSVLEAAKASPRPVILFIDEAHTLIGAGGSAGQNDAANLLKPALARGELRSIAATTWAEYKKYFEKDAALTRRFQVVKVDEPSEPTAIAMVRGLMGTLEKHHGVRILDEAVEAAVKLSARYIPSRQLPDKAVSLIDTACARVGMSQAATPAPIEDRQRRLTLAETERGILSRENAGGADHALRLAALAAETEAASSELAALTARWEQERALNTAIADTLRAIEAASTSEEEGPDEQVALRDRLIGSRAELATLQGEQPLVFPMVDAQAVAEIVETWTGIPAGRMRADEIRSVLNLRENLERRVIGQPHALEAVAQAIRVSRAGLTDPRKPIGVFLMVGTSGVGKTETALALAELLYGGERNLTTINMSEFKEEHKVSLLMGSPPGYIGYGEGGILTEAVRRQPYSVILLDEMEKAHPGVQDVFYQVFDKGNMKDGEGRDIDFKNTVVIMTSNAGTDLIAKLFADPETAPDAAGLGEALGPELAKYFKPAFLGRVQLVPYFPLSDDIIKKITALQLARIARRVESSYGAVFSYDPALVEMIAARCTENSSGARNIETILSRTLLPELAAEVLGRMAEGEQIARIAVGTGSEGGFTYAIQ